MTGRELVEEWKTHPVTEWLIRELKIRSLALTEMLMQEAGRNPVEDARNSGRILEIQDILNLDYEELND